MSTEFQSQNLEIQALTPVMSEASYEKPSCGIVMPISAIDGCAADHWTEVFAILKDSADQADFSAKLVSESEESGIIQKSIVQNIYSSNVVLCDVSGKNPNVMFELGMRLAFDLPTVIVKDDKTSYSFDTSTIEHLVYPRDLRFTQIVAFKEKLTKKLIAAYKGSNSKSFLKSFGQFETVKFESQEVSPEKFIIEKLAQLEQSVKRLNLDISNWHHSEKPNRNSILKKPMEDRLFSEIKSKIDRSGPSRTTQMDDWCDRLDDDTLDRFQEYLMRQGLFRLAEEFILRRATRAMNSSSEDESSPKSES